MKDFSYTLLSDGSSDRVLIPMLTWLLQRHGIKRRIQAQWADLGLLHPRPKSLSERIVEMPQALSLQNPLHPP